MLPIARRLPAVLANLLVVSACGSGPKALPADLTQKLQAALPPAMQPYAVPGAAVAVCVPGYQDLVFTAGVSDLATGAPMRADLVWPLRSVTKSFTVTLLLELVDEGKVRLDDTIGTWVPGVPNGDAITLRQLADMTSGVPEYTTKAWVDAYLAAPTRAFTEDELIGYAIAEPAQFPPGAKAVYVNTSTLLVGRVVERVTGKAFADVLQEKILGPLELAATRYPAGPDAWSGPHPTGYQPDATGTLERQDNNFTVFGAAGAMTSTMLDLCRWGTALGEGELLQKATQAARVQGRVLERGPEYDTYAMGIGTIAGWIGHTGEGFGYTMLVMHDTRTGATVVVGMNEAKAEKHVPTQYFRQIAPAFASLPAR